MHPSVERFNIAAQNLGLSLDILEYKQTTRTAQEAADAIGCNVAQIVKSLCFAVNNAPVIALVSGANQLDTGKVARLMGVGKKRVKRTSAEIVKAATGFSIGGVPPFGHATQMTVFIDDHLMTFDTIWAAAGTPHAVFPIQPAQLASAANGTVADIKKEAA